MRSRCKSFPAGFGARAYLQLLERGFILSDTCCTPIHILPSAFRAEVVEPSDVCLRSCNCWDMHQSRPQAAHGGSIITQLSLCIACTSQSHSRRKFALLNSYMYSRAQANLCGIQCQALHVGLKLAIRVRVPGRVTLHVIIMASRSCWASSSW